MKKIAINFTQLKKFFRLSIQWKLMMQVVGAVLAFMALIYFYFLPGVEQALISEKEAKVQDSVVKAWSIVESYYLLDATTDMDKATAQESAKKVLKNLLSGKDDSEYYWIIDTDCNMVMHPYSTLPEGKNLSDVTDPNGDPVYADMVEIANANVDGGFLNYTWQYGGNILRNEPKISYVKLFKPWKWVIGTGTYVADVNETINSMRNKYLIGFGILAVAVCVGVFFISLMISRNVKKVARVSDRLAIGDTKIKMDVKSSDETGEMGKSLANVIDYLREMAQVAEHISEGDLRVTVQPKSEDDTLGNAFEKMIINLRQLVKKVTDNARTMASSSQQLAEASEQSGSATEQIASVAQQIAKGAEEQTRGIGEVNNALADLSKAIETVSGGSAEQAKAVEQATGIVQQVSGAAEQTAASAQEAATSATKAADVAKQGTGTVEQTITGIKKINTSMQDVAGKVAELGKHSEEIGGMISVIDDIASQTNLLALNAAIEAARAGDQGRGFAVVADEVKKLAERTAKETKEIAAVVKTVQKGVNESIKASMEGAKQAEDGTQLANEAGTALGQILDSINTMTSQIEQISAAAEEMSASANEMVKVVDGVSKIAEQNLEATKQMAVSKSKVSESANSVAATTEENSAATQEMSASTEQMSAQVQQTVTSSKSLSNIAIELQQAVSAFKIGEEEPSTAGEGGSERTEESKESIAM